MTPELVLPSDYPVEILRLRAIDHLATELDVAVMAKTGKPIRIAGLLVGLVLLAGYLDIVAGGFLSGLPRDLYTFVQLAMMAGIVACLGQAFLVGRRMQQVHEAKVAAIRTGEVCALGVLNARLVDVQGNPAPALEPRTVMAESLQATQRTLRAERALQNNMNEAIKQAVLAPTLAETVVTAPQAEPRRIALKL